jgi:hypothetical protein
MNNISPQAKSIFSLIGRAIAERPLSIRKLLARHKIIVRNGKEDQTLAEALLYGLQLGDKNFQRDLTNLLSQEDQFVGQIAGAVGSIASAIGSGAQNKVLKEQARNESLATILAYKAQQDQIKLEQAKLQQGQGQTRQRKNTPVDNQTTFSQNETIMIVAGVIVVLVLIMLFKNINRQPKILTPVVNTKVR